MVKTECKSKVGTQKTLLKPGFRSIMLSDKPPFAISIYFAAIAWVFTHSITTVSDQKLIEYDTEVLKKQDTQLFQVTLRNISKFRFESLEFAIESKNLDVDSRFINVVAVPPASINKREQPKIENGVVTYVIEISQPGQEYKLIAVYKGDKVPIFRFQSVANDKEKKPIQLIGNSAWTWGIRHQGELITLFVLVWGLATIWTLSISISTVKKGRE